MASSGIFDGEFVQIEGFLQAVQFVDVGVGVSEGDSGVKLLVGVEGFFFGCAYADTVSAGVDGSGNVGHRCPPLNAFAPRVRGALSSIRHTPYPVTCTARAPSVRKAPGRHL